MPLATFAQDNFLGGEWSATAQARFSDPKYKISMSVCFNGFPMDTGAWIRRQGTIHGGFTKKALGGRLLPFDFEEATPYNIELTSGYARFWTSLGEGPQQATTNDSVAVLGMNGSNPASLMLGSSVDWVAGNTVFLSLLGTSDPLLQNRTFLLQDLETNLVTQSTTLTNSSYWTAQYCSITGTSAVVDLLGGTTAYILAEDNTNNQHNFYQSLSVAQGTTITWSVFAKAGTRNSIMLVVDGGDYVVFNLATGKYIETLGGANNIVGTPTITAFGNGWYRCSATMVCPTGSSPSANLIITDSSVGYNISYQGVSGDGIYVWGPQVELGSTLSAYNPTPYNSAAPISFSLADEITGVNFNGSSLQPFTTGTLNRIQEVTTPFIGTLAQLQQTRLLQTENVGLLVRGDTAPQGIVITTDPGANQFAQFNISPANFIDGPYLDPPTNGVKVTPSAASGLINLTLSFPAYSSSVAYPAGALVTASSVNYESLVDQNAGNTPSSSPSDWAPVSAAVAINNGQGFLQSDIGRLVRLYSEPALWASGTSYSTGNVVSYNPSGEPGAATYWQSLTNSNEGNIPGTDTTHWELVPPGATGIGYGAPALWTWGKITALLNFVPNAPNGIAQIGNMTSGGGLSSAFNGVTDQNGASSAELSGSTGVQTIIGYVGQNYSGCSPADYAVASATIFPTTDQGLASASIQSAEITGTAYLYGSNSAPSVYNNGTLLGSASLGSVSGPGYPAVLGTAPITITSDNLATTYAYLWVAIEATTTAAETVLSVHAAQVEFVAASGSGSTSNGVTIEVLGASLPYTNSITTWQLGAYSDTTGWPTCGTYADGRIWLSGAIPNRIDACYANGVTPNFVNDIVELNFAPTDQYGNVTAANGISYTFNSPGANPIFWMEPDQQGIICGTQAGEHLVFGPAAGGISPLNIDDRRVTKIRCADILPVRTEHTVVFVQAHQRKLEEYFPDVFSGKFTAPDLTEKFKHLTVSGVAEIAYQQELIPIVWARLNNGDLIGATYKRDTLMSSTGPTYIAGHRHTLGSGNSVQSICAGPSEGGTLDALSLVTLDSNGLYHVEMLTDLFEEGDTISEAWFLDNALSNVGYSLSSTSLTINGLWHLNGFTCTAFVGTLDAGDWPVSGGQMVVPLYGQAGQTNSALTYAYLSGLTTIPILVGFTYTSQGQLHRPNDQEEARSPLGPSLGQRRKIGRFAAHVINAQGLSFGTSFSKLHAFTFKSNGGTIYASNQLFTGVAYRESISDDWSYDGMICWQVTRPWPVTVGAIEGEVTTEK